jgi:hypothetical protein
MGLPLRGMAPRGISLIPDPRLAYGRAMAANPVSTMRVTGARVLQAMVELGYPVEARVTFEFDPDLPIMGYSRPIRGGYRVVAGPGALHGDHLVSLIAHELSHVQRMASGHPSHNNVAISGAYEAIRLDGQQKPYHDEILHDVVNNVEDLYADDIALKVTGHLNAIPKEGIGGFFLAWMKAGPEPAKDGREQRWREVHAVVGNARAFSQIKAHGTPQQIKEAQRINAELLDAVPSAIAKAQPWFQSYLDNLAGDVTQKDFTRDLSDYVQRFVALAEGRSRGAG